MEIAEVYVMTHDEMKVKRVYGHGEHRIRGIGVVCIHLFVYCSALNARGMSEQCYCARLKPERLCNAAAD